MSTNQTIINSFDNVLFLTNAVTEEAGLSDKFYAQHGIAHQVLDDGRYPLTETEEKLIAEDLVVIKVGDDILDLHMGYTALIDGVKYIFLLQDVDTLNEVEDNYCAEYINKQMREKCIKVAEKLNAKVYWSEKPSEEFKCGEGRAYSYTYGILIPIEEVMKRHTTVDTWKAELESIQL